MVNESWDEFYVRQRDAELPITRGAEDFVKRVHRPAPLEEIAAILRTMPYGDMMELSRNCLDSPTDAQVHGVAGLLWLWARNPT